MKKIMIMGAAVEQLPGIVKAKEMGLETAVVDYNPKAIGIPLADKYYNASTIDKDAVLAAARDFGTDGFLTLATDLPMRAVAYACEQLNLPGISYETAIKATDKGEMIKALKADHVESPWYFIIEDDKQLQQQMSEITYPCILKPTDNAASRGVVLCNSAQELQNAFAYSRGYARAGAVILEEYMVGPEVSVEVLTWEGIPHVLAVTDKLTTGAPHFVELGHNQPSRLPEDTVAKIKDVAVRAVKALGITCGPAHVEIIVTEDGPKIVELGARLGGDCITSHLVQLSTGIDMVKQTMAAQTGQKPMWEPTENNGAAIRFLTSRQTGILERVDGFEAARAIPGVMEVSMIMGPGDALEGIHSSDDRVAYVVAQGKDADDAIAIADKALAELTVITR